MMNPSVGLTLLTSSFMILFTMVVLPALSKPLESDQLSALKENSLSSTHSIRIRISLSFKRAFRRMDNILKIVIGG